jgi:hypothetical protein
MVGLARSPDGALGWRPTRFDMLGHAERRLREQQAAAGTPGRA